MKGQNILDVKMALNLFCDMDFYIMGCLCKDVCFFLLEVNCVLVYSREIEEKFLN